MRKKVTAVTKLHAMKCFIVSLNFFFFKIVFSSSALWLPHSH